MDAKKPGRKAGNRDTYEVMVPVFAAAIMLAWGASFDGPAQRISHDYWRLAVPVAVPVAMCLAWLIQWRLVGAWYTSRYARRERQMGPGEAWATGLIASAVLVMFGTGAVANVMNQVTGVPYVATYTVAGKFVARRKHTCYGLTLSRVGAPGDQFEMCVPQPEQESTIPGEMLQVSGRRSKYVDQIVSYTRAK